MNYTSEMIDKAKTATSASELLTMAKKHNIELSEAEAAMYFDFLNSDHKANENGMQELSSAELELVAGGKGEKNYPNPKYRVGQTLWVGYPTTRNFVKVEILEQQFYSEGYQSWRYRVMNHYDFEEEYYLDSHKYVQTIDPKGKWPY